MDREAGGRLPEA